jgi:hypothetical protein
MLKFNKKLNAFANSTKTNIVSIEMRQAISYKWWTYLKVIDGKLVFNEYRYSVTTSKHQRECLNLLLNHGITKDQLTIVNQKESL